MRCYCSSFQLFTVSAVADCAEEGVATTEQEGAVVAIGCAGLQHLANVLVHYPDHRRPGNPLAGSAYKSEW